MLGDTHRRGKRGGMGGARRESKTQMPIRRDIVDVVPNKTDLSEIQPMAHAKSRTAAALSLHSV